MWLNDVEAGQHFPKRSNVIELEKTLKLPPTVLLDIFELIKYEEPDRGVAFERYVDAERHARVIRQYSALVVPDLLQVPAYTRALIAAAHPTAKPEVIDAPPTLWLVVDELALRRPIGARDVQMAQLDALIEAVQLPHVGLQVIPLCTGAHAGLMGGYTILSFADDPDIAYTEDSEGGHFRERPDIVRSWFEAFDALRMATLPAAASYEMVRSIRGEL